MKKSFGALAVLCVSAFLASACQSNGVSSSAAVTSGTANAGSWSGTFTGYVDGTFKDGVLTVQYGEGSNGEFDIDDTNGPLGGTKKMTFSSRGIQSLVNATQCDGDTFQIHHDLSSGDVTFDGTLCGTNITNGSGKLSKQ